VQRVSSGRKRVAEDARSYVPGGAKRGVLREQASVVGEERKKGSPCDDPQKKDRRPVREDEAEGEIGKKTLEHYLLKDSQLFAKRVGREQVP